MCIIVVGAGERHAERLICSIARMQEGGGPLKAHPMLEATPWLRQDEKKNERYAGNSIAVWL